MADSNSPHYGYSRAPVFDFAPISQGGPRIEMIPNPDFSFPMKPKPSPLSARPNSARDAVAKSADESFIKDPAGSHRRAVSTLPNFSFNANDSSGRADDEQEGDGASQVQEEETPALATPSRRGHRRGASEFVGGDSRLGVSSAVSTSPTKFQAPPHPTVPAGPPPSKRGHSHRRSGAVSSHDVSNIMKAPDALPRLSNSLPSSPMDFVPPPQIPRAFSTSADSSTLADPFGPPLDNPTTEERPPSSSRRVGFSDNVTIIPRPLSTISSETESSVSTVRGHSVNNSISSVLSLGTPSPPSARAMRRPFVALPEDQPKFPSKTPSSISKHVEKEGEWLKTRPSAGLKRPHSESETARPATASHFGETANQRAAVMHKMQPSLGQNGGFERRQSEPVLGVHSSEATRLSALSLQAASVHTMDSNASMPRRAAERSSTSRKLKNWASSMIGIKPKESKEVKSSSESSIARPQTAETSAPSSKASLVETPVAETDLDAVLGSNVPSSAPKWDHFATQPLVERTQTHPPLSRVKAHFEEESSTMIDLDAALGPLQTPPLGGNFRQRKVLHSSRLAGDSAGVGGYYHRRTESAPVLAPRENSVGSLQQPSMDDVFEEDEEDDTGMGTKESASFGDHQDHEEDLDGTGVHVVESDDSVVQRVGSDSGIDGGLGISSPTWRFPASMANATGRSSAAFNDVHSQRHLVNEHIPEDDPNDSVAILNDHGEVHSPLRGPAASLTKSSDSSETPTITEDQATLSVLDGSKAFATPDTYQTSAFSSPDFAHHQYSFETSRLGTAASSVTDSRTMSSFATGDHANDLRISVDDVPSLTSSRSTMLSTMHADISRREVVVADRAPSRKSARLLDATGMEEARRKRSSIQSLSQLMGGSFGSKSKPEDEVRPQTAMDPSNERTPKKEHRLKKLLFWRSKQTGGETLHPKPN